MWRRRRAADGNIVTREVRILENAGALCRAAAAEFVQTASVSARENGPCAIALSGGSTPKALYAMLATDPSLRAQIPWDKLHLFFGDERHVPPDNPESNFRMAQEAMLSKAPLAPEQIARIKGEYPEAARAANRTGSESFSPNASP